MAKLKIILVATLVLLPLMEACTQAVPTRKSKVTAVVLYPLDITQVVPGVTMTCLEGCDGRQTKVTDSQGEVTFTGHSLLLTVRAEKPGYITTAEQEAYNGSLVAMSDEWPPEAGEAIRQLGLEDVIASGELLLIWDDDEYLPGAAERTGNDGLGGGFFAHPSTATGFR